ncbi:transcription factor bHLH112-like isoform X2 [Neltuma alba]|uniref:transcription factor bHLH112-like isoform X2 n=1 Tax=Neltuma alba TaxID=207710 RepID=UPI0010A4301B|nr:transcription factor bHLH112-like isoform X2 [Prosopis alba]XP_028792382.1 transcription factor bHLH112-like isoform X2 [Prosopis alba]
MGEEFQAGICGGNNYWWINNNMMMNSTTRSVFPSMLSSSPCSVLTANHDLSGGGGGMIGYSTWQTDTVDLKAPDTAEATAPATSLGFLDATTTTKPLLQNHHHHHHHQTAEPDIADNHHNNGSILMDSSSLEMIMGWNHSLFGNSVSQSQDQKREMSMKNQDLCGGGNFSVGSVPVSSSSTLIQSLYDIPQAAQSLFTNPPIPQSSSMAYSSSTSNNYGAISNSTDQFMPSPTTTTTTSSSSSSSSWSRPSNNNNPFLKSSGGGLHFSNCTPFWNASAETTPHVFAPLITEKPNFTSSLVPKPKREEVSESAKKGSCEPAIKKQRIETPSPLPTFKVRKEKLGDRITALQQLVSPFGKTDTASVLHEAIDYIKFLHEQVLSTPYMKNGVPIQHCQQGCEVKESSEGPKQDLKSRGLCLVPISSTFPVTNETPVDFWTPSFGGTLIR